jgi:hypothetical protein
MSAPAATPAERRLALLEQLAELGIGFAQAMKEDVAAAHEVQAEQARLDPTCRLFPPFDFAETSRSFARLSRAVRLTLALHARLEAGAYRPYPMAQGARVPGAAPPRQGPAHAPASCEGTDGRETESRERLSDPQDWDTWPAAADEGDDPFRVTRIDRPASLEPQAHTAVRKPAEPQVMPAAAAGACIDVARPAQGP